LFLCEGEGPMAVYLISIAVAGLIVITIDDALS
jgi:hypothetical protein